MPDTPPPHESEQFQRALELMATWGAEEARRPEGHEIMYRMVAEGRDPVPGALGHGDDRTRLLVTRALQMARPMGHRAELTARLHDPVDEVRMWAVWALEDYEDPPATQAMLAMLDDPLPKMRVAAAQNLSWYADPRALEPLLEFVRAVDGPIRLYDVRWSLPSNVVADLDQAFRLLKEGDAHVRRETAQALADAVWGVVMCETAEERLGARGDEVVKLIRPRLDEIVALLDDPDAEVRRWLAAAVGRLEDEATLPVLLRMADDPDEHVREEAREGLDALTHGEQA